MEATESTAQRIRERTLRKALEVRVDARLNRFVGMVMSKNLLSLIAEESAAEVVAYNRRESERRSEAVQ